MKAVGVAEVGAEAAAGAEERFLGVKGGALGGMEGAWKPYPRPPGVGSGVLPVSEEGVGA